MKKLFLLSFIAIAAVSCKDKATKMALELCSCEEAYVKDMDSAMDSLIKFIDKKQISTSHEYYDLTKMVLEPIETKRNTCSSEKKALIDAEISKMTNPAERQLFEDSLYTVFDRCQSAALTQLKQNPKHLEIRKRFDHINTTRTPYPVEQPRSLTEEEADLEAKMKEEAKMLEEAKMQEEAKK